MMCHTIRKSTYMAAISALVGCSVVHSVARADTVDLTMTQFHTYTNVTLGGTVHPGRVSTGVIVVDFSNGTGVLEDMDGSYNSFCVDLPQPIRKNDTREYTYEPDMVGYFGSVGHVQAINDLYAGANGEQFTNKHKASAFQLFLWDLVYDYDGSDVNTISLDMGNVTATKVSNSAVSYFDTLKSYLGMGATDTYVTLLTHPTKQDQLIAGTVIPPGPVPEPTTLVLLGSSVGMFAMRRRHMA